MQAVIFAGGLATRLGGLTRTRPKSMLSFNGKPFLQHQIEFLSRGGITEIVLCLGHLSQTIMRYIGTGHKLGVNIKYSIEEKPLGTAGALKKAEPLFKNSFFTIYGDSYVFVDYKTIDVFFCRHDRLGLMTVFDNRDEYDISNTEVKGNLVTNYSKTQKTEDMHFIDYGVHLFNKEVLELIPLNQQFPMENVFTQLIARKQLLAYPVEKRFYEVGSLKGIREFRQFLEQGK
jgi:N-acetyl-alpha-D-muramate 1-phosphate uridylyltransferase